MIIFLRFKASTDKFDNCLTLIFERFFNWSISIYKFISNLVKKLGIYSIRVLHKMKHFSNSMSMFYKNDMERMSSYLKFKEYWGKISLPKINKISMLLRSIKSFIDKYLERITHIWDNVNKDHLRLHDCTFQIPYLFNKSVIYTKHLVVTCMFHTSSYLESFQKRF